MSLVAVAHGTRSPAGQAQVTGLADRVAARRPGLDVHLAYVDVQQPAVADVVAALDPEPVVVVPLLLTAGYHVRVDIAEAVAGRDAVAAPPLGYDQVLVDVLARRIAAEGPADATVLAAAGSSDPRAIGDVERVARDLGGVHIGYAAGDLPRVPDIVARLRADGARRIVVGAYLLVDGLFHRGLLRAGADAVTAPLVTADEVPDLVLARYDAARSHVRV